MLLKCKERGAAWEAPRPMLEAPDLLFVDVAYSTKQSEPRIHCVERMAAPGSILWVQMVQHAASRSRTGKSPSRRRRRILKKGIKRRRADAVR
jgi:hypothetical protein